MKQVITAVSFRAQGYRTASCNEWDNGATPGDQVESLSGSLSVAVLHSAFAALPPDVRKGSAFPADVFLCRGYAPNLGIAQIDKNISEGRRPSAHQAAKPQTGYSVARGSVP